MLRSSVLKPCPDGLVKHLFRIRMEIVAVSGNNRMLCKDAMPYPRCPLWRVMTMSSVWARTQVAEMANATSLANAVDAIPRRLCSVQIAAITIVDPISARPFIGAAIGAFSVAVLM
jgi:hypothetical protein